ncbi:MAG: hypothetical protein OXF98_14140, partial [Rhodospirillaceae bacterium]|nr:hypothetical protein [Rhodospirillaceae bacterium]
AVVARAREYLTHLERREHRAARRGPQAEFVFEPPPETPATPADALQRRLRAVDPDELSPNEALKLVYELVELAAKRPDSKNRTT